MSKSKGNVIDPWTVLDTRGADALRWYFFSAGSPWTPQRVSRRGDRRVDAPVPRHALEHVLVLRHLREPRRLGRPTGDRPLASTHVLDRWVRSRLHAHRARGHRRARGFDALRGAQALERFVDDLSNWYVRRSRPRFWKAADPAAHATLHECLSTSRCCSRRSLPVRGRRAATATSPRHDESVHLADWPAADDSARRRRRSKRRWSGRASVVSLGLSARNEAKLKVRQPLRRALVLLARRRARSPTTSLREIADALNVKQLEAVTDLEGLLDYTVVPNFRALGPEGRRSTCRWSRTRWPRSTAPRSGARSTSDGALRPRARRRRRPSRSGPTTSRSAPSHTRSSRSPQDGRLRGRARPHRSTTTCAPRASPATSSALLNDQRKADGFEIADRIRVRLGATGRVEAAAHRHRDWIAREVLAVEFDARRRRGCADATPTVEIDGESVPVALERSVSSSVDSAAAAEAPAVLLDRARRRRTCAWLFVAWAERRVVAHGFAQRREERVVVERVGCRPRWPPSARRSTGTARAAAVTCSQGAGASPTAGRRAPSRRRTTATTTPPRRRVRRRLRRGRRRRPTRRRGRAPDRTRRRGDGDDASTARPRTGSLGADRRLGVDGCAEPRVGLRRRRGPASSVGAGSPGAGAGSALAHGRSVARRRAARRRAARGAPTAARSSAAEAREVGLDARRGSARGSPTRTSSSASASARSVSRRVDELEDLGFEAAALALGDAARRSASASLDQRLRLGLGLLEQLPGARLRLVHRVVGGALREQQRALQHLGVVAARRQRHLGRRRRGRGDRHRSSSRHPAASG